jgi:hypothetical protein
MTSWIKATVWNVSRDHVHAAASLKAAAVALRSEMAYRQEDVAKTSFGRYGAPPNLGRGGPVHVEYAISCDFAPYRCIPSWADKHESCWHCRSYLVSVFSTCGGTPKSKPRAARLDWRTASQFNGAAAALSRPKRQHSWSHLYHFWPVWGQRYSLHLQRG